MQLHWTKNVLSSADKISHKVKISISYVVGLALCSGVYKKLLKV